MAKIKLSKQTIFTLLGLLVIIASIPLAVILVKQRQEIRKEAVYPTPPPAATPTSPPETDCRCSDVSYARRNCGDGKCGQCERECGVCPEDCGGGGTTPTPGGGGSAPAWGFWATGVNCAVIPTSPPPPPSTPTPTTPTITPTPTVTVTPTPTSTTTTTPTPTPTTPVSCNETCSTDSQCNNNLICSSGRCRNRDCIDETDCSCPGPTPTPTATSTPGPTTTPATVVQATPTPVVELPQAGFALPTFGAIIGGLLLIAISLIFIL